MIEYPILAIDYGKKHFGLAISDSKGIIASPLEVISITKNQNTEAIILQIIKFCEEYKIKTILIGYPQAFVENHLKTQKNVTQFKYRLAQKINLPIILYDESFSTSSAKNMLISSGQNTKGFRSKIDKIAATIFLQEFLNSENHNNDKAN